MKVRVEEDVTYKPLYEGEHTYIHLRNVHRVLVSVCKDVVTFSFTDKVKITPGRLFLDVDGKKEI